MIGGGIRRSLAAALFGAAALVGCRDPGISGNGEGRELWFESSPNLGWAKAAEGCPITVSVSRRIYERDTAHAIFFGDRSREEAPALDRVTCEGDPCPLRDLGSRPTHEVEVRPKRIGTLRLTVSVKVDEEPIEDTMTFDVLPNPNRYCPSR